MACEELENLAGCMNIAVQTNDLNKAFALKKEIDQIQFSKLNRQALARIECQAFASEDMVNALSDDLLHKARQKSIDIMNEARQALFHNEIVKAMELINNAIDMMTKIQDCGDTTTNLEKRLMKDIEWLRLMQSQEEKQCRRELAALAATPIQDKNASLARLRLIKDRAVNAGLFVEYLKKD